MAIHLSRHRHSFHVFESQLSRWRSRRLTERTHQIWKIIRTSLFLVIWSFFAILICITPLDDPQTDIVSLPPHQPIMARIQDKPIDDAVRLTLYGNVNVLKSIHPDRVPSTELYVSVCLINYNNRTKEIVWKSSEWKVYVYMNIYSVGTVKNDMKLKQFDPKDDDTRLHLLLLNHYNETTGFSMTIEANPFKQKQGIYCGIGLMLLLYVLLIFDIMDPIFAAWLVAFGAIGVLCFNQSRPSVATIFNWVDMESLMLLFAMMIMVGILSETGLFDYLAVFAYQMSRGNVWFLLFYLCMLSSFFSIIMDNASTFTLLVPVTMRLCETLQLNTMLVLISIAIFSNIGGSLTPVGDTPNVIIGQDSTVNDHGITFLQFAMHMLPGVLASMFVTWIMLYFMIRHQLFESQSANPLRSTRHKLLAHYRRSEPITSAPNIQGRIKLLVRNQQNVGELHTLHFIDTLAEMKAKYRIRNKVLLIKCSICFGFALIMFALQSLPTFNSFKLCWSAALSAILLVMLVNQTNLQAILKRVEWSQLVYLAALFVLMECLVEMGFIDWVGELTIALVMSVDKSQQLTVGMLLLLWTGALSSACVDSAPMTTMLLKVTIKLAANNEIPFSPLIWALSFGVCLGGNSSLIGASMNYLLIGLPITIATVLVASAYLLIAHCVFHWHAADDTLKIH